MPDEPPPGAVPPGGKPVPPASPYQAPPPYPAAPPPHRTPPSYQFPPPSQPAPLQPSHDGLAVAGFVLSVIGVVVISVILCVVALRRIRRSGASGRGFAIAGLVISGVWVVLFAGLAAAGLLPDPPDATAPIPSQGLRPGVCLSDVPDGDVVRVHTVACASPHRAVVAASFDLPDGAFPGNDAVVSAASDGCLTRLPAELRSRADLEIHFMHPRRRGWDLGDRQVICLITASSGDLTEDLATLVPSVES